MKVIRLDFLSGRYHATPWGRNVNEGVVEWPPSPFRIARALFDAARRRFPDWDDDRLTRALELLAGNPKFHLPPASASHVRFFMSTNKTDPSKRQKIFDAFVAVARDTPVLLALDTEACTDENRLADLGALAETLNYLGRSESWVRASVCDVPDDSAMNCNPIGCSSSGTPGGELVPVACLRTPVAYSSLGSRPTVGARKNKREMSWLEALSMASDTVQEQGWSQPPALQWVDYSRPAHSLDARLRAPRRASVHEFRFARFSLSSTVLPRVEDTLLFSERVRRHLMGIHKAIRGEGPQGVSPLFSGKDATGKPAHGHGHVFLVPRDENGDGRLDHLELWSARPFDESELRTLGALNRMWQAGGRPDVELLLTGLQPERPRRSSRAWVSANPFVTARHHRQGRGEYFEWLADDLARELELHGLPRPVEVQWLPDMSQTTPPIRWASFVRSRKENPPSPGYGARLLFAEPVEGPFVLGALCHYGLGLFVPAQDEA